MKKPKNTRKNVTMDALKKLGEKYGVKVTDMSERGVRAIGMLGGIKMDSQCPATSGRNRNS